MSFVLAKLMLVTLHKILTPVLTLQMFMLRHADASVSSCNRHIRFSDFVSSLLCKTLIVCVSVPVRLIDSPFRLLNLSQLVLLPH